MIKLIACDMDGTLLDSKKRMPDGIYDDILRLKDMGIRFAVASGRQYASLRRALEDLVPHILFICENGSLIMEKDRQLFVDPMQGSDIRDILLACKGLEGVYPVVCRAQTGLIEASADPAFIAEIQQHYPSSAVVENLLEHCDYGDICEVACFDKGDAQSHLLPVLMERLGDRLKVVLSGEHWVDIIKGGVNKGTAMRSLQKQLGITPQECMAFGDYLNDVELLESVEESYAMKNGHPHLLAMAKHIAPSNDEDGVMRVIRERFYL